MGAPKAPVRDKPPRTWLLHATHVQFLEGASRDWCHAWGGEDGVETLQGTTATSAEFLSAVTILPMFRDLQVVRLSHAEGASDELEETLRAYVEKPSPSTALLVEYVGDLAKRPPKLWAGLLEKVDARDCTARSARTYIQERARAEGFKVEASAIAALEEWANKDLALLPGAMELLLLYRAQEKMVQEEDVESLLGTGGTPKLWTLQDALFQRDRKAFLKTLAGLEADPEQAPLAFVGMVARQLRLLLVVHSLLAQGLSRREIAPKQLDPRLQPFQLTALLAVLPGWPETRVREAFDALYRLDLALKGDPGEPWAIVERHLLAWI